MKLLTCLFLICTLSVFGKNSYAAEIWVAPNGNDANAGTRDYPKLTIAAAIRQARELRRLKYAAVAGGIHIIVKDGEYILDEPLFIRPEDSGTASSPTLIENAPNARPVISGGAAVNNWKRAAIHISGLPTEAQGRVWEAHVPKVGGNTLLFRQLWINGKKAVRARESDTDEDMGRILSLNKVKQEIYIAVPKVGLPKDPGQMEMVIHQMWAIANLRMKSITVEGNKANLTFYQPESRLEFEHPWPAPVIDKDHKMNGNSAFYLTNSLSFLNRPGEWYEDLPAGKIYYWPRKGENLSAAKVIAPSLEKLVQVTGTLERPVSYVFFKGLSFVYTTWLRPSLQGHVPLQAGMYLLEAYKLKIKGTHEKAGLENQAWIGRPPAAVELTYVNHTGFENCTFNHLASTGLDYVKGTHDDEIKGNLFRDIGGTGIQVGMYSDEGFETHLPYNPREPLEVCTNEHIENNLVTDVTNEDWGCLGISAGYVKGILIAHNEIADVSYSGISVGWGWTKAANAMSDNIIKANKVHHYAKHMYDVAGIYTLSTQLNSIIDSNYIDNIYKVSYAHDPQHWFYLYTDEGSSYFTVKDNWTPTEKFLKNANGPGNVWENNGPHVADKIKNQAGLEPEYRYLLTGIKVNADNQPINHVKP
ncbi:right-handed parallel beta-helix repeat-containing protein [Mucilaginibacter sp.]|uniref:right-handed parallel beta-helix repeat-containing protein n=1 Tax=Mucilaginibacter sp. TaxID=1882438 RepID=UPI002636313E|nr:right-handed parallel beta-helix repeat-containing protein [Mucilaginibacter sp.]MDB4919569.1 right-handed parallel beta-helix repeat-containing protein [Mucilaginibacter sp.]